MSVDKILHFEQDLFDYFDGKHADLLETIRTTKDLPDTDALDAAITDFLKCLQRQTIAEIQPKKL